MININFGMTNAPFMLFSIAKNIFHCCNLLLIKSYVNNH
ncbi:hypothetical protein AC00_1247 [Escherichia coli 1-250-04_S3_C1]|uniref:Uncharacterized protein n=1 Tax=Escherichia coli 1-250-04_S3_C1 TaxID=1444135 RepID=A0AAN4NVF5_ECOLX|nr:hypothetical protein AC00_1247 [Escherichia coli 1-250-04_S3_C1]